MPQDELPALAAYLIGAPRSGTTWLQSMLASHPSLVSPQETDLISRYAARLWESWVYELERPPSQRVVGLYTSLTQQQFEAAVRDFVHFSYRVMLAEKPGATVLLEKSPEYSLHTDLISTLVPTARFIHLIRDGRDVVASLTAASRTWGRRWAPPDAYRAADMWSRYVGGARRASRLGSDQYLEVRYEDLVADPAQGLMTCFEFLQLEVTAVEASRIAEAWAFDRVQANQPAFTVAGEAARRHGRSLPEPKGFYREGIPGGWRDHLKRADRWAVHQVAGGLLEQLSYEADGALRRPLLPRRVSVFRVREIVRATLHRWVRSTGSTDVGAG